MHYKGPLVSTELANNGMWSRHCREPLERLSLDTTQGASYAAFRRPELYKGNDPGRTQESLQPVP